MIAGLVLSPSGPLSDQNTTMFPFPGSSWPHTVLKFSSRSWWTFVWSVLNNCCWLRFLVCSNASLSFPNILTAFSIHLFRPAASYCVLSRKGECLTPFFFAGAFYTVDDVFHWFSLSYSKETWVLQSFFTSHFLDPSCFSLDCFHLVSYRELGII